MTHAEEERELAARRDHAARHDARRNETLTRGEVLDALENVAEEFARYRGDAPAAILLRALIEKLS